MVKSPPFSKQASAPSTSTHRESFANSVLRHEPQLQSWRSRFLLKPNHVRLLAYSRILILPIFEANCTRYTSSSAWAAGCSWRARSRNMVSAAQTVLSSSSGGVPSYDSNTKASPHRSPARARKYEASIFDASKEKFSFPIYLFFSFFPCSLFRDRWLLQLLPDRPRPSALVLLTR